MRVAGRRPAGLRVRKAARERGALRLADVHHVQSAAAALTAAAAHDVREPALLVDDDVVSAVDAVVSDVGGEFRRSPCRYVAEPGQVEHLHAVLAGGVRDDEHVVAVDLHVAPHVRVRTLGQGQVAQVHRVHGVGHVDERRAVHAPDDRVLAIALGIRPAPDIVELHAPRPADVPDRQEREQVHVAAAEYRHAVRIAAAALVAGERGERRRALALELRNHAQLVALPLQHGHPAEPEIGSRNGCRDNLRAGGHGGAELPALCDRAGHASRDRPAAVRFAQRVDGATPVIGGGRSDQEVRTRARQRGTEHLVRAVRGGNGPCGSPAVTRRPERVDGARAARRARRTHERVPGSQVDGVAETGLRLRLVGDQLLARLPGAVREGEGIDRPGRVVLAMRADQRPTAGEREPCAEERILAGAGELGDLRPLGAVAVKHVDRAGPLRLERRGHERVLAVDGDAPAEPVSGTRLGRRQATGGLPGAVGAAREEVRRAALLLRGSTHQELLARQRDRPPEPVSRLRVRRAQLRPLAPRITGALVDEDPAGAAFRTGVADQQGASVDRQGGAVVRLELGRSRQDAEQGEEQGRDDSRDTKHAAPPLG